jgi:serine/threonine protein kinase
MIGQTISHFHILEKLGEGGMGVVYRAEDINLKRTVALKFLPRGLEAHEPERARFLQEAQAASAINHANVCTIYEISQHEGQQFIVMECVDGKTLREMVPVQKIQSAIDYAIQIGEALQEAHSKGIVHRDIKTDNIMVNSKNQVKVMDFGLAKLKGSLKLTKTSSTVGTLAYMAPEQIQGAEVDARSDIFSFGVVLFEMLTGRMLFRGEHEAAMMYSILNEAPEPLQKFLPDPQADLQHLLDKALEKDPEDRYQNVGEIVHELRRIRKRTTKVHHPLEPNKIVGAEAEIAGVTDQRSIIAPSKVSRRAIVLAIGIAGTAILCVGVYLLFFAARKPIDSIAVLPFVNVSADPNTDYLTDGLTETLINNLTKLSQLRVVPRSTVFQHKGKESDPLKVGRELNVRAVLTGRITQRGDNLNIQTELIDVKEESQLWGEQYDRKILETLSLQQDISKEVAQRLHLQLSGIEEKQLTRRSTENSEAYQLYLKGRFHWNKRTVKSVQRAVEFFRQAIEIDPLYTKAYCGIADCYILRGYKGPIQEAQLMAKDAAMRALRIDSLLADAHTSLAFVLERSDLLFEEAERHYQRAIAIDPKYATAHQWYGLFLILRGKPDQGIKEMLEALALDPLSLMINADLGLAYYWARKYDEGIAQLQKTLELDSSYVLTHRFLAYNYAARGMKDEAIRELLKEAESNEVSAVKLTALRKAFEKSGWRGYWRESMRRMLQDSTQLDPYLLAKHYMHLDDRQNALRFLEEAANVKGYGVYDLRCSHSWDAVRLDPRFIAIINKLGL